ncbi:squalene synthase HpnC [Herbaspirillum sp. YR522]|uniref:squalene synthase HpnC n=1 Tax=Herbaspirillum sp. YR522 TaxID=1144342 RepID=UPI00026F90DC|nr:squalene synthase HpnC [Herbaspirillum sp. YR522]EJN07980.1 squalene synthase HpnC [Herbaspirillum sp. YR522]
MAVNHYENFPVASLLLPPHLRAAVAAIYAFARSADDIADEGDASPPQRLAALASYSRQLDLIEQGARCDAPIFDRLQPVITQYSLPIQPFRDLLSAFSQDVVTTRYARHDDLLDYCRRSANPVGTLMLHLYGQANAVNLHQSDAICSALQLINFWQDVAIDWQKGRIYLPLEDLDRFGVSPRDIQQGQVDQRWRQLMQFELDRTRALMLSGAPLAHRLPGRIGWELRLVVQGGLRILERIEAVGGDIFTRRPRLGSRDWLVVGWRGLTWRGRTGR